MAQAFKRGCISLLVGAVAIYCAVAVIQAVWPVLVVILGIAGIIGLIVGGIVVFKTMRERW
jgi:hypothetical protein